MTATSIRRDNPTRRTAWPILRGIGGYLLVVALAVITVYVVIDLLPGDAATMRLGLDATPEQVAALRAQYGLDRPLAVRLSEWVLGVLQGDFGTLASTGTPITDVLWGPILRSGTLAGLAMIGILVVGLGGGLLAGLNTGRWPDRILSTTAVAIVGTPEFVIAAAGIALFSAWLGWLPAVSLVPADSGILSHPDILVLPVCVIVLMGSASVIRLTRPVIARQRASAHVEAARLSGLNPSTVLLRHLLPGAVAPTAQALASVVPYLVGGTVVVERAFGFPGVGSLLVQAVGTREVNLLMACAAIIITVAVAAYKIADAIGARICDSSGER